MEIANFSLNKHRNFVTLKMSISAELSLTAHMFRWMCVCVFFPSSTSEKTLPTLPINSALWHHCKCESPVMWWGSVAGFNSTITEYQVNFVARLGSMSCLLPAQALTHFPRGTPLSSLRDWLTPKKILHYNIPWFEWGWILHISTVS